MFWLRVTFLWLLLMAAESVHGILRRLFLVPVVGEWRAKQIGVLIGAAIILTLVRILSPWLRAPTAGLQAAAGCIWTVLTVGFELSLGRAVFGDSWDQIFREFDPTRGGLMPIGLLVLAASPWLAARRWHASGPTPRAVTP